MNITMISISDAALQILTSDDIALEAMRMGLLNMSSYANKIHTEVETITHKKVKSGTIVVALARIQKQLQAIPNLKPEITIEDLSIKSPLTEVTYEKTNEVIKEVASLNKLQTSDKDFFVLTQGLAEITIIGSSDIINKIIDDLDIKPKSYFKELVCVTARFNEKYLETPNVIYMFVSSLAMKRINLIEIISTYTELSFILHKSDLHSAIESLNKYFTIENT